MSWQRWDINVYVKSFIKKHMLANSVMMGVILVPDPGLLMRLLVVAAGLFVVVAAGLFVDGLVG